MLKLFVGHKNVTLTKTTFPAGESCIRIDDIKSAHPVDALITLDFKSNSDLFDLALLVDATRRMYLKVNLSLRMDYLPYARQDRVCNVGESLSVKVVANFINSLNFVNVFCKDIHSSVGVALLNNLVHMELGTAAKWLSQFAPSDTTALVSPDAGAEKKVVDFAKEHRYTDVLFANKKRDMLTGNIVATTLSAADIPSKELLIVDDICDGGRTFVELAKVIKAHPSYTDQRIMLYVTHGIFSAGLEVFDGYIDRIFVANLMNEKLKNHPLLTEI